MGTLFPRPAMKPSPDHRRPSKSSRSASQSSKTIRGVASWSLSTPSSPSPLRPPICSRPRWRRIDGDGHAAFGVRRRVPRPHSLPESRVAAGADADLELVSSRVGPRHGLGESTHRSGEVFDQRGVVSKEVETSRVAGVAFGDQPRQSDQFVRGPRLDCGDGQERGAAIASPGLRSSRCVQPFRVRNG